jgi:hypothetical protein
MHYPDDIGHQASGDIALRRMFCHFMAAAALISEARAEANIEARLQNYLQMRKHVKGFGEDFEAQIGSLDTDSKRDIRSKLCTLLVFDFEGALSLQS